MFNLYTVYESFTSGYNDMYLNILSLVAILCGVFVIVSKNPIISVLYLIGLFLSIAIYLMLQGLNFLGLAYLLVYVGAVSILFLFILMLINVRISEIVSSTSNSIPLGILVGTILYTIISKAFPNSLNNGEAFNFDLILSSHKISEKFTNLKATPEKLTNIFKNSSLESNLGNEVTCNSVMSPTWDGMLTDFSHISVIGNVIYTSYSLWLILTSLILLLAMVGTIVITIKV